MGWTLSEPTARLDSSSLADACNELSTADPRLGDLIAGNGVPPMWPRPEGFPTMVKIVLEQQVSLDSAAAAYSKLEAAIDVVDPAGFLTLDDAELKAVGFSRQKTGYCRGIAEQLLDQTFDFDAIQLLSDLEAKQELTQLRGIGPWTADVYLLFALRRPDVWPNGDRALVISMAESLPLDEIPTYEGAERMAESWRPWRSVAARVLWHAYLKNRGRSLE